MTCIYQPVLGIYNSKPFIFSSEMGIGFLYLLKKNNKTMRRFRFCLCQIFTIIFPVFLPLKRSINACGIFSNPCTTVSE